MYRNFFSLAKNEHEGKDYRVSAVERKSPVIIVAPHGGGIEPGTKEIAQALAGQDLSFYAFEGMKQRGNYGTLHITSSLFDEPQCVRMVKRSVVVMTVHGCKGRRMVVRVGGRDTMLKMKILEALQGAGIRAELSASGEGGAHVNNICNRGTTGRGVQLEISMGLRLKLLGRSGECAKDTGRLLEAFVEPVRGVLLKKVPGKGTLPTRRRSLTGK